MNDGENSGQIVINLTGFADKFNIVQNCQNLLHNTVKTIGTLSRFRTNKPKISKLIEDLRPLLENIKSKLDMVMQNALPADEINGIEFWKKAEINTYEICMQYEANLASMLPDIIKRTTDLYILN